MPFRNMYFLKHIVNILTSVFLVYQEHAIKRCGDRPIGKKKKNIYIFTQSE